MLRKFPFIISIQSYYICRSYNEYINDKYDTNQRNHIEINFKFHRAIRTNSKLHETLCLFKLICSQTLLKKKSFEVSWLGYFLSVTVWTIKITVEITKNIMNAIYGCNWMHSNTTCGGLNKFIIFWLHISLKFTKFKNKKMWKIPFIIQNYIFLFLRTISSVKIYF